MAKRFSKKDSDSGLNQRDWNALCSEFNLCKRKLQAKTDGLLVLAKELDNVRQEKDAYKLMAEQLREKYQGQKRKYDEREKALGLSLDEGDPLSERRSQSLAQILCETREQNRKYETEISDLKQKLIEAEGDIKLLRESIARQRVGDEGVGQRHFPAHEREELVSQLEASREQVENLERDMVAKIDEFGELVTERDYFRNKAEHLNEELNYVLGGDERRIVDIDAIQMENKYLKERLHQVQEEKSHAQATAAKYKSVLEKKKGKTFSKNSGSLVISQKQVEKLLNEGNAGKLSPTAGTVADLHSLSRALLETVHDKNVALNHQRNTNKILGKRVEELEKKLKTLEVAGLWNLPPARNAALKAWQKDSPQQMETLVPRQVSLDSDASLPNGTSHSSDSPRGSKNSTPTHSTPTKGEARNNDSFKLITLKDLEEAEEELESKIRPESDIVGQTLAQLKLNSDGGGQEVTNSLSDIKDLVIQDDALQLEGDDKLEEDGTKSEEENLVGGTQDDDQVIREGDDDVSLEESDVSSPRKDVLEDQKGFDQLEDFFDTFAERMVKRKLADEGEGKQEKMGATAKTPLLSQDTDKISKDKEDGNEGPSVPFVDTSPQCV